MSLAKRVHRSVICVCHVVVQYNNYLCIDTCVCVYTHRKREDPPDHCSAHGGGGGGLVISLRHYSAKSDNDYSRKKIKRLKPTHASRDIMSLWLLFFEMSTTVKRTTVEPARL